MSEPQTSLDLPTSTAEPQNSLTMPTSKPTPEPQNSLATPTSTTAEPKNSLVVPITSLILRVLALILLLISLILLATDSATYQVLLQDAHPRMNDIYSYRYMISTTTFGLAYTLLQLPFAIYHLSRGKRLVQNVGMLYFDFISDKVISSLVATGVGAGFGASCDLKNSLDDADNLFEKLDYNILSDMRSEVDNFFDMGFASAAVLLFAFFCIFASSIISSLALSTKSIQT